MKLVRQDNGFDCGIAVAAMVAGVSWAKAAAKDREAHPNAIEGLSVNELVWLCGELGTTVKAKKVASPALDKAAPPKGTVAILIRRKGTYRGHFVALDKGSILDPELGRCNLATYPRRHWLVLRWFVA